MQNNDVDIYVEEPEEFVDHDNHSFAEDDSETEYIEDLEGFEEEEYMEPNPMDEIIPNLWIGNMGSAQDIDTLQANRIHSVLSAMRGKVRISETFNHLQIDLDDTQSADVLALFPKCIEWIEGEIGRGRGVLVHCMAGMSRSCTIVAAYLMYTQNIDSESALEQIISKRPSCLPNTNFLTQLDVFYRASYKVSRGNKETRMFYLERAVDEVMNGDGTLPSKNIDMLAKFPRSPNDSVPATPNVNVSVNGNRKMNVKLPKRRIRCRMCRQELATREHMLDHGQVGPATPATPGTPMSAFSLSPAVSRRPSASANYLNGAGSSININSRPGSRRGSGAGVGGEGGLGGLGMGMGMTPMTPMNVNDAGGNTIGDNDVSSSSSATMTPALAAVGMKLRRPSMGEMSSSNSGMGSTLMRRLSTGTGTGTGRNASSAASLSFASLARRRSSGSNSKPLRPSLLGMTSLSTSTSTSDTTASEGAVENSNSKENEVKGWKEKSFSNENMSALDSGDEDEDEDDGDVQEEDNAENVDVDNGNTPNATDSNARSKSAPNLNTNTNSNRPTTTRPATETAAITTNGMNNSNRATGSSASVRASTGRGSNSKTKTINGTLTSNELIELKKHFDTHPVLSALRNPNPANRHNSGLGGHGQGHGHGHARGGGGGGGGMSGMIMTKMSDEKEKEKEKEKTISPPLLINPKCSGYFVEPMKWMHKAPTNHVSIAGKITCPNPKCDAKLGNYDWAGVKCACGVWVVPGFCIHRSKVDEIV